MNNATDMNATSSVKFQQCARHRYCCQEIGWNGQPIKGLWVPSTLVFFDRRRPAGNRVFFVSSAVDGTSMNRIQEAA